jgi:hypothetical protein
MLILTIHKDDPIIFRDESGEVIGTIEIAEKAGTQFCRLGLDFPPEFDIRRKKFKKPFNPKDYGAKK